MRKSYWIREAKQLDCLASGVRQEIIDTVQSLGECSIADIARMLGRPADGLYYHVKELVRTGLLVKRGTARGLRREEVIYTIPFPRRPMRLEYHLEDPSNRERIAKIVRSMLNTTQHDFEDGLASELSVVKGERRNLWAARKKGWLNREEIAEVNALLMRLSELFGQPRSEDRQHLHVVSWVLAPVTPKPLRRD